MKRTVILLKNTAAAIGTAAMIFCIVGVVIDILGDGTLRFEDHAFTKMAVGTLVTGLGFGLPALVYENDRLPTGMQTLIHMGTGCVIMTVTAFIVGWIPTGKGLLPAAAAVAGEIAASFAVWVVFYISAKRTARKINERLNGRNTGIPAGGDSSPA